MNLFLDGPVVFEGIATDELSGLLLLSATGISQSSGIGCDDLTVCRSRIMHGSSSDIVN